MRFYARWKGIRDWNNITWKFSEKKKIENEDEKVRRKKSTSFRIGL